MTDADAKRDAETFIAHAPEGYDLKGPVFIPYVIWLAARRLAQHVLRAPQRPVPISPGMNGWTWNVNHPTEAIWEGDIVGWRIVRGFGFASAGEVYETEREVWAERWHKINDKAASELRAVEQRLFKLTGENDDET